MVNMYLNTFESFETVNTGIKITFPKVILMHYFVQCRSVVKLIKYSTVHDGLCLFTRKALVYVLVLCHILRQQL